MRMLLLLILICYASMGSIVLAENNSVSQGPAANSLEEIGKTTWFDPKKQSIVPVPLTDNRSDTIHRDSRWLPGAKKVKRAAQPSTSTSGSGSTGWFNTGLTTGNLIGWAILGVFFVAVTAAVLYAFSKINPEALTIGDRTTRSASDRADLQTLKRIEELPAELRRTDVDLLSEAERLMNLGQLDEAIKCLFGHQLLLLDRRGFLRLSRGKTNGRYVIETRRDSAESASLLKATVNAFEASYFGRHPPTTDGFHQLWQDNKRLEMLTRRETEIAA